MTTVQDRQGTAELESVFEANAVLFTGIGATIGEMKEIPSDERTPDWFLSHMEEYTTHNIYMPDGSIVPEHIRKYLMTQIRNLRHTSVEYQHMKMKRDGKPLKECSLTPQCKYH